MDSDDLYGPRSFIAENKAAIRRAESGPVQSSVDFSNALISSEECGLLFASVHNKSLTVRSVAASASASAFVG